MAPEYGLPPSDCPGGDAENLRFGIDPDALEQIARLEVSNAALEARVAHLEAENQCLRQAEPAPDEAAPIMAYLAQLSMPSWLATEDGVIVYANPAYDRILLPPHRSAVGQTLDTLYPPEYAQQYNRNNTEVLDTKAEVEVIEQALLPDGTVGTYLVHKFPVAVQNQRWVGGIATNITALKRTELHLQQLVARWQLAVEGAADGVWDWNLATNAVVLSPQWKAMLGYGDQEVGHDAMGHWEAFVHPDDRDCARRDLEAHLQGKTPIYQHEHRLRCRDGSYRWVLNRGKVIERAATGEPLQMIGTHTDISDRKRAEHQLRQSEARFMAISDASPANIYILVQRPDGSLYFEHMSQSVEAIHEVSAEAVLADATIVISHIHPDDRAAYAAAVQQSRATLAPFCHEWRIVTPSRKVKWLQGQSQPQRRPNGDTAWYGVVIDISALKRAEAERQQVARDLQQSLDRLVATQAALQTSEMQLSGVLNSSLDGIVAFRACRDESGHIVDFEGLISNSAACKLLHLPDTTLVGHSMLQVLPGNKTSGIFDHYVRVVETGKPYKIEIYYPYDQIDGWYEVVAVKLGDGIAITFRNITRIKQSELALQAANQQLELQVAQLNRHNTEMQRLGEMSDFLQACPTLEAAYGALAKLIEPLFPDCGGGVVVAHRPAAAADPGELTRVAHWGAIAVSSRFHSQACWAIRKRCSHWAAPGQLDQCCGHLAQGSDTLTTLCVPIAAQGAILGLLHLISPTPEGLNLPRQQLGKTVAKQLALALANLHLRETLRYQSIRDPLTGLFNRRYLEESLQKELIAAQRHGHCIGIIMLDLDHFKQFNDTHGHDAGDRALQAVAQLLQASVRGSDIACRYGGEEITLILPGLALAETQARGEEIRQAIAALTWPDQADALTASLGVACFPQHGASSSDLLKASDTALYQAKQSGRNCVVAAG